jgi:hypothetical protein
MAGFLFGLLFDLGVVKMDSHIPPKRWTLSELDGVTTHYRILFSIINSELMEEYEMRNKNTLVPYMHIAGPGDLFSQELQSRKQEFSCRLFILMRMSEEVPENKLFGHCSGEETKQAMLKSGITDRTDLVLNPVCKGTQPLKAMAQGEKM